MISRRSFLKMTGAAGLTLSFGPDPVNFRLASAQEPTQTIDTARQCIFVFLDGGPSHSDSFDYKQGNWTPDEFGGITLGSGARWPDGVMPNLATRDHQFSLIRSIQGREIEHSRAIFFLDTARKVNQAHKSEIPAMGSVISAEFAAQRRDRDIFPSFVSLNRRPPTSGFLPSSNAGYFIGRGQSGAVLNHPNGQAQFQERYQALLELDPVRQIDPDSGSPMVGFQAFYEQARGLMYQPQVLNAIDLDESDRDRYGQVGDELLLAYQLVKQDFGARFLQVSFGSWDNHIRIYPGLTSRLGSLDMALAALLDDLEGTPGVQPGKTLLDETLVLVMGEFGRTPGPLNSAEGRDHHNKAFSALIAGGGVKGGRVIGRTDEIAAEIVDSGWSAGRPIVNEDLAMTIYSALGIDYRKTIFDTPSGRAFQYVPASSGAPDNLQPVLDLF